jgi:DNA-binding transcriptional regulator GbsR (MarR family)
MPLGVPYDERHFVEELGLAFAADGQPRMMGRMLAWLLVCQPPEQSAGQLVEALKVSKATVSTTSRDLIALGLIERVARPGDRKTYFEVKPEASLAMIRGRFDALSNFAAALCRALEHLEAQAPDRADRLREVHDLYAFLERELPLLLQRWEQTRSPSCVETS